MFLFSKEPDCELQSFPSEEKASNALVNLHFVLGIDETLCSSEITENEHKIKKQLAELEEKRICEKRIQFRFQDGGRSGIALHVLHRGAIEFIQWLCAKCNARVSFFSSRINARDKLFVAEFLSLALGAEGYERVKETISICSFENLKESISELEDDKKKKFGLEHGSSKKDLTETLGPGKYLDKTVYISDYDDYVSPNQEKNSLIAWSTYGIYSFYSRADWDFKDLLRLNNIFYIVGILKEAFSMTFKGGTFLDNLFGLQFKLNDDGVTYHPIHSLSVDRFKFYRDGLHELQKINPSLQFYGSEYLYDLNIMQGLVDGDSELNKEVMERVESIVNLETQLPASVNLLILSFLSFAWKYKDGPDVQAPVTVFFSREGSAKPMSIPESQTVSNPPVYKPS